ncbi:hypothetical protein CEXT_732701 [Caerostris extrusa]|uniref:Uncharacterized protein n=1 Tax=Caerostris extrusa TaxID=172846 RepID=A0AAV4R0P2_CAEEX|nr:hypothetical protein CEXT_732701 [Caerostris extrusa]
MKGKPFLPTAATSFLGQCPFNQSPRSIPATSRPEHSLNIINSTAEDYPSMAQSQQFSPHLPKQGARGELLAKVNYAPETNSERKELIMGQGIVTAHVTFGIPTVWAATNQRRSFRDEPSFDRNRCFRLTY